MALESRVVSLNFVSGLDQKTDAKLTTKLTTADNVVLRKNGTIEKRLGFVANGAWSVSANPVRAFPFREGEFVVTDYVTDTIIDPSTIAEGTPHSIARVNNAWVKQDKYSAAGVRARTIFANVNNINNADMALINQSATQLGVSVFSVFSASTAFGNATGFGASDLSTESELFITGASTPLPVSKAKVLSLSATSLTAIALNFSGTALQFTHVTSTTAVLNSSATWLLGCETVNPQVDAAVLNGKIYFATKQVSTTGIIVGTYDPALFTISTTVIAGSATADVLAVVTPAPGTDRLRLVWANNTNHTGYHASYSLTLSQILAPTTFSISSAALSYAGVTQIGGCENTGITTWDLFMTFGPASATFPVATFWPTQYSNTATVIVANGLGGGQTGCSLAAKPALIHGVPHLILNFTATASQCFVVVKRDMGNFPWLRPCARYSFGLAAPNSSASYEMLPNIVGADADTFFTTARRAVYFNSTAGAITTNYGVDLIRLDFSQTSSIPIIKSSGSTIIGSGYLQNYDGNGFIENGFLTPPVIAAVSTTTSPAGVLTIGNYSIVGYKEFTDQSGRTHRSAPSLPVTVAVSSTVQAIKVFYYDGPTSLISPQRYGQIRYVFTRTQGNGSIYYRDTSVIPGGSAIPPNTLVMVSTQSLTISDATLSGGDIIYTQGGALPNWTPDGVEALCEHKERLFCNDLSDVGITRYSKIFVQGEGIAFAQLNTINHPGQGGRVSAYSSLDSNLIGFKQRLVFAISGEGPDDTGQNGSFGTGQLLFNDVGCINQRNLCRFKDGIVFKSPDKGFYLITRDLQCSYVGAEVENYNSKTVVSSEVVALAETSGTAEECRFLCSDGTLLTYNYYNGQWTTATLAGCTDAVQTGGRYVVVNPSSTAANARVFQQSLTTYLDAYSNTSTTYQMAVETGWVKTADVQGFQRIWKAQLLGDAVGPGAISIEVGYDYESSYNESYTFQMSSMTTPNYTGGAVSAPQCDLVPVRQKCQAIRFRIKDYPGATGVVMKLTNISIECAVKKGVFKLPAAKGT